MILHNWGEMLVFGIFVYAGICVIDAIQAYLYNKRSK